MTTEVHTRERGAKMFAGGSVVEAIGGIGTVVLAILGLAGVLPIYAAGIAVIAAGVAFLFEAGAIGAEHARLMGRTATSRAERLELGSGMSAEALAGIAGIVLGILALLRLAPNTLISIAVIVFGAALLLSSASIRELNHFRAHAMESAEPEAHHHFMSIGSVSGEVLAGAAVLVLGIVALAGISPTLANLVALLVTGAALLLGGAAIGGRLMHTLAR